MLCGICLLVMFGQNIFFPEVEEVGLSAPDCIFSVYLNVVCAGEVCVRG